MVVENKLPSRGRDIALVLSALLFATVMHMYFWRADWYAAMTVWPVWFWLGPGLLLVRIGWRRRWGWVLTGLWGIGVLGFMDEPRSLLRTRHETGTLRVVSLNCAGEDAAAAEIAAYHPDIVLIQESPSTKALQDLARVIGGALIVEPDRTLIVRGEVTPVTLPKSTRAVRARVRTAGVSANVVCLRLWPHPMGDDFWSPELWKAHAAAEREQRDALQAIINDLPADEPVIVGGDFNAPVGDPVYRLMPAGLRDSFREAGSGWGNTLPNGFPLWRIDQIWISRHFCATSVVAQKTKHSDHRLVVCELRLAD